jgi:hypothetical protein
VGAGDDDVGGDGEGRGVAEQSSLSFVAFPNGLQDAYALLQLNLGGRV